MHVGSEHGKDYYRSITRRQVIHRRVTAIVTFSLCSTSFSLLVYPMRLEEANITSVALEKALRCLLESIEVKRVGGAEARVHVPVRLHC